MPKPSLERYEQQLIEKGPLYRMQVAYIGTAFSGFQSQPDRNAIQDHLERALSTILRHPVRVRGASRTDRGVHALQQVAVFRTHLPYNTRWLLGMNALVPTGIGVLSLVPAATDFDPIYDARSKVYRYRIWRGRCFNPFLKAFVWPLPAKVDLDLFRTAAEAVVGRHDFSGFCNKDSDAKTTVRRVLEVRLDDHGPLIDFWVCGEGFLKQMVRIMVGTLVEIASGKMDPQHIHVILAGARREIAGTTAPASGLCLVDIFYGETPSLAEVAQKSADGYSLPLC